MSNMLPLQLSLQGHKNGKKMKGKTTVKFKCETLEKTHTERIKRGRERKSVKCIWHL